MTKLCKNCTWHKNHDYNGTGSGCYDECLCPEIKKEPNPVTGTYPIIFCSWQRCPGGECGIDGKYWMENQPKENFWSKLFNFK